MSKSLGSQLNEDLLAKLERGAIYREGGLGLAVLTVDPTGFPHVALAPGAVAVRPDQVCFALGGASRSLTYACQQGKATLLLAGPDTLYYIKGRVAVVRPQMQVIPQEAALMLTITDVLQDMESFVTLTGGISYRYGVMHDDFVTVIRALLDELHGLAEGE